MCEVARLSPCWQVGAQGARLGSGHSRTTLCTSARPSSCTRMRRRTTCRLSAIAARPRACRARSRIRSRSRLSALRDDRPTCQALYRSSSFRSQPWPGVCTLRVRGSSSRCCLCFARRERDVCEESLISSFEVRFQLPAAASGRQPKAAASSNSGPLHARRKQAGLAGAILGTVSRMLARTSSHGNPIPFR